VPSGNFGNICAGILAYKTGLPVQRFIAACNANKVVPEFMHTQLYAPQPAVATISNAMDVGNPSNFVRVLELFQQQFGPLANILSSVSVSDDTTKATIAEVHQAYGYMLDPHGAVAYAALKNYLQEHARHKGILLETAHPVKFINTMQEVLDKAVLKDKEATLLLNGSKQSVAIEADFAALKFFLKKV
jgi:threonine synthase